MLTTAVRQLRYVTTMLRGGRFDVEALRATVRDLRDTLDEFGEPGDEAHQLLAGGEGSDAEVRQVMADRRIRRAVQQAARHTAYYRLWFDDNGIDPERVGLADLSKVASTPKAALRGAPAAFVSDRSEPILMAQTTGTTGSPTMVWFSRYELELAAVLSAITFLLHTGVRSHHVVMACVSSRGTAPIVTFQQALSLVGAGFVAQGLVAPPIAVDRLATPMHLPGKEPQVTHLATVPSYLAALVDCAEREGWRPADFGLRQIVTGSEVLTGGLRERAEEVFGAPVADVYAMTELVPVSGLVCSQQHLHLAAEQAHVEVLDVGADSPTPPGDLGELVATPYAPYRETTLLLRYRTGDLVRRLPDGSLSCEFAGLPATSPIMGRAAQFSGGPTSRAVLEVLQAERALPMPTRYTLSGDPVAPMLHVVADGRSARLLARLEDRATARRLAVSGIALVEDPAALPAPCRLRADLYEHSFETSRPQRRTAPATTTLDV
jgi:phenylacetate-coenzyme A ligase PaaK-like adenylate-forming protein